MSASAVPEKVRMDSLFDSSLLSYPLEMHPDSTILHWIIPANSTYYNISPLFWAIPHDPDHSCQQYLFQPK